MSKRTSGTANPVPSGRPGAGGAARGRRQPTAPIKKPFPWGTVLMSGVLGVLLIGIVVYAVANQGSGAVNPLKKADDSVPGVQIIKVAQRSHVQGPVTYDQTPPVGGNHNATPQTCQVYTEPIANEHAVHSLEHGAAWLAYRPDLPPADVSKLAALVKGNPFRLMSPYPGLPTAVSLQAWGRQLTATSASDPAIGKFLDAYTSGPQSPEPGASCSGTQDTGPLGGQNPATGTSPAA